MLRTVSAFERIGEENAFAVLARATQLMAQGRDIINLGIGQPDFRTPEFIVEAAIKALRDGHHGYTPAVGIPPLREAVAADLHKRFKVEVSPDSVTPKSEVDKLVAGLEKWPDVALMSDEIYDHMVYDGEKHVCLLSYPSIRDRLILLNGWSKTYAMTGWRLGYAIWPGKLYDYARKLAVNLHSCVNAAAQYAGLAALKGPQDEVAKMVAEFDRRRKVVLDGLNRLPGISCVTPKGAFYAFPNMARTGWKAKKLAAALLEEAGVALIGGPDFGILAEGYVRLSYANSTENILKALDRMGEFLASRKAA